MCINQTFWMKHLYFMWQILDDSRYADLLIKAQTDVNIRGMNGTTPLTIAV